MADKIIIKIPDIGGATDVDVIEIMVKPGDEIKKDAPLITLESDKASMEIPSPEAGKISSVDLKVGDKVSEGDIILTLVSELSELKEPLPAEKKVDDTVKIAEKPPTLASTQSLEVCVPDIGGALDVDVIEVLVSLGQKISKDQSLITLEGDKATMDIPAPAAGIVKQVLVKTGDKVSQGSAILQMQVDETNLAGEHITEPAKQSETPVEPEKKVEEKSSSESVLALVNSTESSIAGSPAVRRLARELGVNLAELKGTGRKSRVTKEDIQNYVKARLKASSTAGGFSVPKQPAIDFSKFGEIEIKPLNKIKRLTGVNVHRSWITIPHVTQFDEADITELEAFRKSESDHGQKDGYKLTVLAFVTKVVAKALKIYPQFNASLDSEGENLVYKHYCNIGIAVETPNGLVVPVIKNADQLSVGDIALEMARLSTKARDKGLMPADMSGGCFTISSLGGIGGTAFTPIVNSPEVAILGLSRASMKPIYDNGEFKPRLMLPLSLSYDHRVIDGAEAARFTRLISELLSDIRRILL